MTRAYEVNDCTKLNTIYLAVYYIVNVVTSDLNESEVRSVILM